MSENLSPQEPKDSHTKEFWLDSKFAAGEKFLIKVHLPVSYFKSDTTKYSVLYLTDADWFFGTAMDCAYALGFLKTEIIVIGIAYGSPDLAWRKRGQDLKPAPDQDGRIRAERFLQFMQEELFPKVETEFRVNNSDRTLFGWSLGGVFALYTLFNHAELFAKYLVAGAPLFGADFNVFQLEASFAPKRKALPKRLYLGTGDLDPFGRSSLQEFIETLEKRNYPGLQFKWEKIPNQRHEFKSAANLLANGLDYLYGNLSIVTALRKVIAAQGLDAAISEYQRLKREHAEDYHISEGEIDWLGYGLLFENKIAEAIEFYKLNVTEYPNSWNAHDRLGNAYQKNGAHELAIRSYEKSLELNPDNTNAVEILKELQSEQDDS
jgi:predicted alpha/beta superfamily hydrolase